MLCDDVVGSIISSGKDSSLDGLSGFVNGPKVSVATVVYSKITPEAV